jgi:hypothetical protein
VFQKPAHEKARRHAQLGVKWVQEKIVRFRMSHGRQHHRKSRDSQETREHGRFKARVHKSLAVFRVRPQGCKAQISDAAQTPECQRRSPRRAASDQSADRMEEHGDQAYDRDATDAGPGPQMDDERPDKGGCQIGLGSDPEV